MGMIDCLPKKGEYIDTSSYLWFTTTNVVNLEANNHILFCSKPTQINKQC
jgi:hypothetical protein